MSTGSLQVFVDVGEQYNVIVDTSETVVISDQGSFYAVADFATTAATASYILLSGVDGFAEYSSSVADEISGAISGSGFTPLTVFNSFTSSFEDYSSSLHQVIQVNSGSNRLDSYVNIFANLTTDGLETYLRSNKVTLLHNYIHLNRIQKPRAGFIIGNLSGSSGISGSLIWDSTTEAWYAGLTGSESRLLTQVDLDVLNNYTSSRDQRIDSLREVTGSYATTGSNTFKGDQIITGSVSISSDGLLIFTPRERPTSSIPGALFYSSSGELYVGM